MARISRPHRTRRKRLASPYFRGAQDFALDRTPRNPYRPGSGPHNRYQTGFSHAARELPLQPLPWETLFGPEDKTPG